MEKPVKVSGLGALDGPARPAAQELRGGADAGAQPLQGRHYNEDARPVDERSRLRSLPLCIPMAAAILAAAALPAAASKLGPQLRSAWDRIDATEPLLVWVEFADKGAPQKAAPDLVSARSLRRRLKVGAGVDARDLPVAAAYVEAVRPFALEIRQRSKWFNRVSAVVRKAELRDIERLACVRSIDTVGRFRRPAAGRPPEPAPAESPAVAPRRSQPDVAPQSSLDYGPALPQLARVNVPAVHDRGISGQGVLVGHFDNGYRLLSHEAFASGQIVGGYDFVDRDPDPAPPVSAPDIWGAHGIHTLSVVAANKPGRLIGAAYGAQFLVARTENDGSESQLEEDNWVAAMEWADSIGVDVISSSVGYLDGFDPPYRSYTWQDMNGNTTIITRAADLAVARGMVVVNAVGNQGTSASFNTLVAPADGDSVLSIGGVNLDGSRYTSSSNGPTTSVPPRIKPDVLAQAQAVWVAGTGNTTHYGQTSGTSFAAPMVAGVAALLLSAVPQATPLQIGDALRATASRAATPDNYYGWGIVNALAALERLQNAVQPASMSDVKRLYR